MEPQCARPDRRRRRNASAERRRMIFGAFRYGGMTGVTNLTRLWQGTARYLNSFVKRRCEEQGISAESWHALQVSFSTGIAIHRDSQNVKGTHNFLCCSGKNKGGAKATMMLLPASRRQGRRHLLPLLLVIELVWVRLLLAKTICRSDNSAGGGCYDTTVHGVFH